MKYSRIKTLTMLLTLAISASLRADTLITPWGDGTITVNYSGQGANANLNAGNMGAIGGNTSGTAASRRTFYQISSYNVAQMLTDLGGISLSQLGDYTFTYAGTTVAGTSGAGWDFADTYFFNAAYIGQWADTGTAGTSAGDVPQTGNWAATPGLTTHAQWTRYQDAAQSIFAGTYIQGVNLGIFDDATAQSLSATGFDLSGLATLLSGDTDLTDNYVFFGFFLNPNYAINVAANQEISGVTLTAVPVPVPEPGALALGALGLLLLRRRKK